MSYRARSPSSERCVEHEGRPFEFYCRSCQTLGCSTCVLEAHRDHTTNVCDAPDVLPEHLNKLKALYEEASTHLEVAQDLMDTMTESIGKLKENKECAEKRIRNYFHKMRNILVDREHHFINIVRRNAEEKKKISTEARKPVTDLFQGLVVSVKKLWDLSTREGDIMILKEKKILSEELERTVKLLKELQNSSEITNPVTTITLPCIEDQNFEKICRLVGDPSFGHTCPPDCGERSPLARSPKSVDNVPVLFPPPLPPKPSVKKWTNTDDALPEEDDIPLRPANHPRSKSSIDFHDPSKMALPPPPVPPRSPMLKKSNRLPQWILDYKDQLNKENEELSPAGNTSDSNKSPTAPQTKSTALMKPPLPKPRTNLPKQKKEEESVYEKSIVTSNGVRPYDLKLENLKINVNPPTPDDEMGRSFSNSSLQPESQTSKTHFGSFWSDTLVMTDTGSSQPETHTTTPTASPGPDTLDYSPPLSPISPTLRVYEIPLKQNIKKAPVYPSGVCAGPSNTLVVWDTRNCCVRIITNTGKFLDYIEAEASNGERHLQEPVHVCVDRSNNLLILDASPPRILKYSNTGKYLSRVVPKGLRSSPMMAPRGMTLAHNGNILVTDWNKCCVHVFDSSGKYIKNFGSADASSGQFLMQPTGITTDSNGRVVLTDSMAHHIWIYTPEGVMLNHFGWHGRNAGELHTPLGVTVDSNGHIYITEEGNNRVSVFEPSGKLLKCFGRSGVTIAEFKRPTHLCINSNGSLVVPDEDNHRLQIFEISQL